MPSWCEKHQRFHETDSLAFPLRTWCPQCEPEYKATSLGDHLFRTLSVLHRGQ